MTLETDGSEAGLSTGPVETRDAAANLDAKGRDRYSVDGILGRGGMGEVLLVRDQRLGRDVALKRMPLHVPDGTARARLAHEAAVTAQLEHPGIVPVYDAGVGEDGAYYTMRLARGQALARLLESAPAPEERLALLRPFLSVCEALAYAHSQGVVHRDLKPSNVMVGDYGETVVVDWGIAARVAGERHSGRVGTPAYVSPEQARGEAPDPRHDVFSLGCILHEIVTGSALREGGRTTMVDAARAARVNRKKLASAVAPAELKAMVRRALASPELRYADAAALADDVRRFLDGRRVDAHRYSQWELVRRFVHAFRVPLAIAALACVAIASVGFVSWTELSNAERRASGALERTDETLAWALEGQAVSALRAEELPEAEVLAAHALMRKESADARGVLCATRSGPGAAFSWEDLSTRTASARVLDATLEQRLESRGDRVTYHGPSVVTVLARATSGFAYPSGFAVIAEDRTLTLYDRSGHTLATRAHTSRTSGAALGPRSRVLLHNIGYAIEVLSVDDGTRLLSHTDPCESRAIASAGVSGEHAVVACASTLNLLPFRSSAEPREVALPADVGQVTSIAIDPSSTQLAIGTARGWVATASLATGHWSAIRRLAAHQITSLAFLGASLAVLPERSSALLVNLKSGAEHLRFPRTGDAKLRLRDGALLFLGARTHRARVEGAPQPRRVLAPEGLAHAQPSLDGTLVASARGDGRVDVWELLTGRWMSSTKLSDGVVKRVAWTSGTTQIAAGLADLHGSAVFDAHTGSELPHHNAGRALRRLVTTDADIVVGAPYAPGLLVWETDGEPRLLDAPRALDLEVTPDRRHTLLLSTDGEVLVLHDGHLASLTHDAQAVAIAGTNGPDRIAIARPNNVWIRDSDAEAHIVRTQSTANLDVAISPDGSLIAVATRSGDIELIGFEERAVIAVLRGHTDRASTVAFVGNGLLVSSGWDRSTRIWDVAAARQSPAMLLQEASRRWGLTLERVLEP